MQTNYKNITTRGRISILTEGYKVIVSFYLREWYTIWEYMLSNFLVLEYLTLLKIIEDPKVILF